MAAAGAARSWPSLVRRLAALAGSTSVLRWAVAASVAVHGGLIAAHFGGLAGGQPAAAPPALRVALQRASVPPDVVPVPLSLAAAPVAAPLPVPEPASSASDPGSPPPARISKVRGSAAPAGSTLAMPLVPAQLLLDRNRLAEHEARMGVEFPIEIDRPVRMAEPILARYPPGALAQGRGESVGVWILVNAQGEAEEVQVLDGSAEFADEVLAAINAAKFIPAENRLHKIRFPLALEFEFRAEAGTAVASISTQ